MSHKPSKITCTCPIYICMDPSMCSRDILDRWDARSYHIGPRKNQKGRPQQLSQLLLLHIYISHAHPMRDPNYCVRSQTAKANGCPFIDFIYILYIFCVKQLILFDTTDRSGLASYVRMVTVSHIMPNTITTILPRSTYNHIYWYTCPINSSTCENMHIW